MKKNFSVNIGGRVFNIDDDAYEKLTIYMNRLQALFANEEGKDEILADIELRIAELLEQKKSQGMTVTTLSHVEEAIAHLGEPDQFEEATDAHTPGQKFGKSHGKLFRDPDNRQIGGVASGIAAWFGVDPVWVRLVFALLTLLYGTGLFLYIILWLIIPEAHTTSEKLEMQRQVINISTLRKEVNLAGSGLKQTGSKFIGSLGEMIRFVSELFSRFFKWLVYIFVKLCGVTLIFFGLSLIVGFFLIFLVREQNNFNGYFLESGTLFAGFQWLLPDPSVRWQVYIAAILIFVGVLSLLFYAGLRLLIKWPPFRWTTLGILALIIVAGILFAASATFMYSRSNEKSVTTTSDQKFKMKEKKLYITSASRDLQYFWNQDINTQKSGELVLGGIDLTILPSPNDSLMISVIRKSSGSTEQMASVYASGIGYNFQLKNSLLTLNPLYTLPRFDGMRYQKVIINLMVPVNVHLEMDREIIDHVYGLYRCHDCVDYYMSTTGLKGIRKPENDSIRADTVDLRTMESFSHKNF